MRSNKRPWTIIVVFLLALFMTVGFIMLSMYAFLPTPQEQSLPAPKEQPPVERTIPEGFRGIIIPSLPAPEISIHTRDGKPFSLSNLKNKIVLIAFATPVTEAASEELAKQFLEVYSRLESSMKGVVEFVLIPLDPKLSDEDVKMFVRSYNYRGYLLTGSKEEVEHVLVEYSVGPKGAIYLIDHNGKLRATYTKQHNFIDIIYDIRLLLKELIKGKD
jgi:cytochrome oxidase Cu insertion factor (SCO1/SenC/PrrC family)